MFALVAVTFGFSKSKTNIPELFISERASGANIATELAKEVNVSVDALLEIDQLDREGRVFEARQIVSEQLSKVNQYQVITIDLADHLGSMAKASATIKPEEAKQLAIEAISTGVAMVSRLITYNALMDELFQTLDAKFLTGRVNGKSINNLVTELNNSARDINELNTSFNAILDNFDQTYAN